MKHEIISNKNHNMVKFYKQDRLFQILPTMPEVFWFFYSQVFAFSVNNDERHWRFFDWSKVTTVVMFNYLSTDLMCLAHSHGARAVIMGKALK